MQIKVICGNGGDWEYCRDKYLWECWLQHNLPDAIVMTGITDDCTAAEMVIQFREVADAIIFKLKAPQYITP